MLGPASDGTSSFAEVACGAAAPRIGNTVQEDTDWEPRSALATRSGQGGNCVQTRTFPDRAVQGIWDTGAHMGWLSE